MPNRVRSTRIRRGRAKRGLRFAAAQKRSREEVKEERQLVKAAARGFAEYDWE